MGITRNQGHALAGFVFLILNATNKRFVNAAPLISPFHGQLPPGGKPITKAEFLNLCDMQQSVTKRAMPVPGGKRLYQRHIFKFQTVCRIPLRSARRVLFKYAAKDKAY